DQYTFVAAPTVTSLAPTAGPTAAGTNVVITGTNLPAATAVKFGATDATGFVVNSAVQITATAPAGAAGTVDVTVTTAGGTSATKIGRASCREGVQIAVGLDPTKGPTAGGTKVGVTRTNL